MLVTGGLSSLVYAITQAGKNGWGSAKTLGFFAGSVVLLAAFAVWEQRHPEPLMRFGLLRTKTVAGANVAGFIMGTALFSMFLMLTLYMQQVLGYSPMKTGVGYLAVAGTAISDLDRRGAARHAARRQAGARDRDGRPDGRARATSLRSRCDGTYLGDLLPGFLLVALGIGFSFVPISIAALAGVQPSEAGLASGLINTSQQIGGALGIAILSTIATIADERQGRRGQCAAARRSSPASRSPSWSAWGSRRSGSSPALRLIRREELQQVPEASPEPALELAA